VGAERAEEWLAAGGLVGQERLGRVPVDGSMRGRGEAFAQEFGSGTEPDDRDAGRHHRLSSGRIIDHTGRRADDIGLGCRQRIEQLRGLARMHRVDAFAIAQLADGRARRRLDVDIGIAPRPTEPLGEAPPDRRLARAHQPGEDHVLACAHRDSVAAYTRRMGRHGPIEPPAVIGILGGGQLGRMLAMAARAMGYRIAVLDPDPDCPAAAVADTVVIGSYDDVGAALRLADVSDVVTYELEHVAVEVVEMLETRGPVRPGRGPLVATQDRLTERRFIESAGGRVAPWRAVQSIDEALTAAHELGLPIRLKVPIGGYDGRGQVRIVTLGDLEGAWQRLGRTEGDVLLAERELDFDVELSIVVARSVDGAVAAFPIARNLHDQGILVESVAPAPVARAVAEAAVALGTRLAQAMDLCGTLTAELFLRRDGSLVVNELAPRVHNSGHWTIEGAATSQFEQHIRAICGLGLGSTAAHRATAMVNLLGTGPRRNARLCGVAQALADPDVHLHLYDKRSVFERRKMGHLTAPGVDVDEALAKARAALATLRWADDETREVDR
jgi:5-(carboxyamino)imidazole ribonucleotide synthase